jgi:hypothetical protein
MFSPGEVQEPQSIPPSYLPPHFDVADREGLSPDGGSPRKVLALLDRLRDMPLGWFSRPKPLPDRAKHFLARRRAETHNGYAILYGVYYVEALMIADDMFVLYSSYYDFIIGRVVTERIFEQYYSDVVAIERSNDYRMVPLSFHNAGTVLEIEDVPTLSLILPGGDRRTLSFAGRSYYEGILRDVEGDPQGWSPATRHYVDQAARTATEQADAALNVLRKSLRSHKRTI